MPTRRLNDAQAERILWGLSDPAYRQKLARDDAGLRPGQPLPAKGTIKRTVYDTAMRRYQRYVTQAGQKRNIANAPKAYQADMRSKVRRIPPPPMPPRIKPPPPPQQPPPPTPPKKRPTGPGFRDDIPAAPLPPGHVFRYPKKSREQLFVTRPVLQTIIAFHDGDLRETARALKLSRRDEVLLEILWLSGDIDGMQGSNRIEEKAEDWLDSIDRDSWDDIKSLSKALSDMTDTQRDVLFHSIESGELTFGDWMDAWASDSNIDSKESRFWLLWREVYRKK